MTVAEAASKALEILIIGDGKYYTKETIRNEFASYRDDEPLSDVESAWSEVKYLGRNSEVSTQGLTAKLVAEYGGEGQGDDYWVVLSLSDGINTRYFRKDGWYASYDGGSLDGD